MSNQKELNDAAMPAQDENSIIAERRAKLASLREAGVAYPNDFRPTHKAYDLHGQYDALDNEALEANPVKVVVGGRMMLKRVMGRASFATVMDASGPQASGRIQLFLSNNDLGKVLMAYVGYDNDVAAFCLYHPDGRHGGTLCKNDDEAAIKVVGNIYDNPELIHDKKL